MCTCYFVSGGISIIVHREHTSRRPQVCVWLLCWRKRPSTPLTMSSTSILRSEDHIYLQVSSSILMHESWIKQPWYPWSWVLFPENKNKYEHMWNVKNLECTATLFELNCLANVWKLISTMESKKKCKKAIANPLQFWLYKIGSIYFTFMYLCYFCHGIKS